MFELSRASRSDAHRMLAGAYGTLRTHVHRAGDALERYAAIKIERRVKPPIVAALALGGAALAVGLVAVLRK